MNWQPPDEIRFPRKIPPAGIFFCAIAAALFIGAVWEPGCLLFAIPLLGLGIGVHLMRPAAFSLRFGADAIEHRPSGVSIRYEEIACLRLSDRCIIDANSSVHSDYFIIGHARGLWRLPHNPQVNRVALYEFLLSRSRLTGIPAVLVGRLGEVLATEIADFGEEQVLASIGRPAIPGETGSVKMLWGLGLLFLVPAVGAVPFDDMETAAGILGAIAGATLFVALLATLVRKSRATAVEKIRAASGFVLSPRGLTLESPALKGVLRWSELKGVTVVNRGHPLLAGLLFQVDGAQILLNDLYACPLTEIHRRIQGYLSHEGK